MHATCRAHLILLDLITLTVFGKTYSLFLSMSSVHCSQTPSVSKYFELFLVLIDNLKLLKTSYSLFAFLFRTNSISS